MRGVSLACSLLFLLSIPLSLEGGPRAAKPYTSLPWVPAVECEEELLDPQRTAKENTTQQGGFSELALFLLGSGFALFIALLGWSDQIRNFNRDSIDLLNRFIERTGIRRTDFRRFLKPKNPQERLSALTAIMQSGRLKTQEEVELSGLFNQLEKVSNKLERLYLRKYELTLWLTACLFVVGTISLFTAPTDRIEVGPLGMNVEFLIVLIPLVLVIVLVGIVVRCNHWEKQFNDQLTAISERN